MLLAMIGFLIAILSGFTFFFYQMWQKTTESGVDRELLTAALMAKDILPPNYHDRITGKDSVNDADYLKIVGRFNELCKQTGMEYLWSLMVLDGKIVFTSGTSPSKDANQKDQAGFLEVHSNPGAYTQVFESMQPQYENIQDKWGHLRAVLVPFYDAQGRKYLIGASRRTQELDIQKASLLNSLVLLSSLTILIGALLSFILANAITRPIETLKKSAEKLAAGDYSTPSTPALAMGAFQEITSLAHSFELMKQAVQDREMALQKSESQYRLLTENNKDVVWTLDTETLRFLYCSPSVQQMRGYTPEEILAQPLTHALTPEASEYLIHLVRSRAEDFLNGKAPSDQFYTNELEQYCKDGSTIWVEVITGYYLNPETSHVEVHGVTRDISQRKHFETALKESEAKYRVVADNTYDWEYWLDPSDQFVYCSPSCLKITGHAQQEFMQDASLLRKIIHPEDMVLFQAHRHDPQTRESAQLEIRILLPDGATRWIGHVCGPVFSPEGGYLGIRASNRDINDRILAEQALRSLAETESSSGEDTLKKLVRELAHSLRKRFAMLAQIYPEDPNTAHTLTVWDQDHFMDNFSFDLQGTPCLTVLTQGACCYSENIQQLFPQDPCLVELGVESYWGMPLHNSSQQVIGLLAVFDTQPMQDRLKYTQLFGSFATRAAAELERTQIQQKLQAHEKRTADIIEFLPDATIAIDNQKRVTLWNRAMEKMTGIPAAEMLGQGDYAYTIPFYGERRPQLMDLVWEDNQEITKLYPHITREGNTLITESFCNALYHNKGAWIYGRVTPLYDQNGKIVGAIESIRDITERKLSEEKIQETQKELQRLLAEGERSRQSLLSLVEDQKEAEEQIRKFNRELEERVRERTALLTAANQELEAFSYSVSHDLRAPLRSLEGFSTLLLEDYAPQLNEQGRHYLIRIQEASRRMGQLINDLLNLSRITRTEFVRQPVDLSTVAREISENLQNSNPKRQATFEISHPMLANCDENLIKIVLENLLNNAYKFTSKNEHATIQVGVLEQAGEPIYFVRDNGVGFDMAYASHLFTPFQRLHGSKEFPGTGIGLSIVQRIITRHGGRIWPESVIGLGTTFYFTLGGNE
jgi:PAS domain S-box-containing protein